jgi:AAT family amino acid transporter
MMAAVTFVGLMVWISILYTHYRFRSILSKEELAALAYRAPWWPYSTWFALAFIFLVIVLMSFHEDARMALVVGPILLTIYLVLYFVLGLDKKEKFQLGEQK